MRLSLILGSMCSIPITLALFMPFNITILIGQAINGIGENLSILSSFICLVANHDLSIKKAKVLLFQIRERLKVVFNQGPENESLQWKIVSMRSS